MPFIRTISILIVCSFITHSIQAESISNSFNFTDTLSCPVPVYPPIYSEGFTPGSEPEISKDALKILSKKTSIEKDQFAKFTGGVTLIGNQQTIFADSIEINRQNSLINAQGNIHFQNTNIDIFADQLIASETSNSTRLTNSHYQLKGIQGRGQAELISLSANGKLSLIDSSYTTCVNEIPDWQIHASEISISQTENIGRAYNTVLKIRDIPVMYIPYVSFPITNKRTSGLINPSIRTSKNSGLEIALPIYWNIAENMDLTITPHLLSKRGMQLEGEFRYLDGFQSGIVNIEYLNKDDEYKVNDDPRYLARIQHTGTFSDAFRAYIDYTTMSDDNYLIDIGSEQYNANDAYLYQIAELSYFGNNWQAKVQLQDFEVLGNHKLGYRTPIHLELLSHTKLPFWNGLFDIYSEISEFQSANKSLPQTKRYHLEAGVTFPVSTPAWFFNSEFKLMQTNYHQANLSLSSPFKKNVSRTLPKLRFHGGMNFDRNMKYIGKGYRQTLEPQLQYLYIPEKDQSNIAIYDSTLLQEDFGGLFRERRYSGLDRITPANQFSWGVTSRILNSENKELFHLSLGQIIYINERNDNELININDVKNIEEDQSALAADIFLQLSRKWQFEADIQYNTHDNETDKSQLTVDYQIDKNNTLQLNHRYTRSVSETSLEQISLLASTKINKDWRFFSRITKDLQQKRSLESYAGVQYESCCWAIQFAYHRHINTNLDEQNIYNENRDEFDSGFKISISTQNMFNASIFGYKRPYFLNN